MWDFSSNYEYFMMIVTFDCIKWKFQEKNYLNFAAKIVITKKFRILLIKMLKFGKKMFIGVVPIFGAVP